MSEQSISLTTLNIPTQESVNAQILAAVRQLKAYVDDARATFSLGDATINAILDQINGEAVNYNTSDRLTYLQTTIATLKTNLTDLGYDIGGLTLREIVGLLTTTSQSVFILAPDGTRYSVAEYEAYKEEHGGGISGCVVGVVTPYQSFCIAPSFPSRTWGNTTDNVAGLPSSQTGSFLNVLQNGLIFQAYEGTRRMLMWYNPEVLPHCNYDSTKSSDYYNDYDCVRFATYAEMLASGLTRLYDEQVYIVTEDENSLDGNNNPTANAVYIYNGNNYVRRFAVGIGVPRIANNITGSPAAEAAWTFKVTETDTRQWLLPTINHYLIMTVNYTRINECLYSINLSALPTGGSWACQQYSAGHAYYVAIPSGNVNGNNKNTSCSVVRVSAL